jgi:hypothetical protein
MLPMGPPATLGLYRNIFGPVMEQDAFKSVNHRKLRLERTVKRLKVYIKSPPSCLTLRTAEETPQNLIFFWFLDFLYLYICKCGQNT